MSRTHRDEPQSLRLYPKITLQRTRRELGDGKVRSRWTRETVNPFDTPAADIREVF